MKRGILTITLKEFTELIEFIDIKNYAGSTLGNKLGSVEDVENDQVRIQVSEEELEQLLDDIGLVTDNDNLISLRKKISDMLLKFRSDI
jgi:hypothetical protein